MSMLDDDELCELEGEEVDIPLRLPIRRTPYTWRRRPLTKGDAVLGPLEEPAAGSRSEEAPRHWVARPHTSVASLFRLQFRVAK
jgi:hypothetical protein